MGFFKRLFENIKSDDEVKQLYKEERSFKWQGEVVTENLEGIKRVGKVMFIWIFEDRLLFSYDKNNIYAEEKMILKENITSIKYMTGQEIREKSKLGQMLVIGLLALGTQSQEKINYDRVVLNVCEDGIDYSIIFSNSNMKLASNKYYKLDNLEMAKKLNRWYTAGAWE